MFPLQSYTKSALARLYFPHLPADRALRKLEKWIRRNPTLHHALYHGRESKNDSCFSRRQVTLIIEAFDPP